ncbi:MAG: nucleotidyltransferase family protein [Casimicrobiaceae bacterium]|nr:nucleotidyltransferase family protein [Casimicrobiaceae bacterium]
MPSPSAVIKGKRDAILACVARHRARNPRVFGSVARSEDTPESDLDLLVDPAEGATLFYLGELQVELEALLGIHVDVVTPDDLPASIRKRVCSEARPL